MAFQFAHIQTYSRKGNSTNRSVAEICAEAGRVPGHHPHVAEALLPKLIAGDFLPEEVPEEIERRIAEAKAKLKGKTKKTKKVITVATHVLEAQVYSHPVYVRPAPEEHEGEDRPCLDKPADREAYESWRDATVEFVYREAERRNLDVLSIVEHLDEAHPHIHALLVPTNVQINAKHSHPGHIAAQLAIEDAKNHNLPAEEMKAAAKDAAPSARAGRKGGDSAKPLGRGVAAGKAKGRNRKATDLTEGKILQKIGNRAYSTAMRAWQDLYYDEVGIDAGLLRLGPQRFRWSRDEYMQRKQDAQVLAEARRIAKAAELRREAAEEKVRRSEESIGPGSKFRQKMEQIARDAVTSVDAAESEMADLQPELDTARDTIAKAAEAAERIEAQRIEEGALKKQIADLSASKAEAQRLLDMTADTQSDLEKKIATTKADEASARQRLSDVEADLADANLKIKQAAEAEAARKEAEQAVLDVEKRRSAAEAALISLEAQAILIRRERDAERASLDDRAKKLDSRANDIDARWRGLAAWAKGRLHVDDGKLTISRPREGRDAQEELEALKPAERWLTRVLPPLDRMFTSRLTGAIAEAKRVVVSTVRAWSTGLIYWREDRKLAVRDLRNRGATEKFLEETVDHPDVVQSVFALLPDLTAVHDVQAKAESARSMLTAAEDRHLRNTQASFRRLRGSGHDRP